MRHDWTTLIDKYYPGGTRLRDIYIGHCRAVADLALRLNRRLSDPLDPLLVEEAVMLHDIGIYLTHAPGIECRGSLPYIRHGLAGGALLRSEGFGEDVARVCERHTGTGLTASEIEAQGLPLPSVDLLPLSRLERLVCYADKFYSKGGGRGRTFGQARADAARFGAASLERFDALAAEFGSPESGPGHPV